MPNPLARLTSRLLRRDTQPADSGRRLYFTRGSDLIPYGSVTRSFETDLLRAIGSSPQALNDGTLARVFAASWVGYSAAEFRATLASQFPLMAVNKDDADEQLEATPLDYIIGVSPEWLHRVTISTHIWGRFYLRKRRNARGFPTGLEWINPIRVREEYERGNIVRRYQIQRDDWSYEPVEISEIVYGQAFDPNPDGRGLSKLEAALKEINVSYSLAAYAGAFFVNGAHVDGMMSVPAETSDDELLQARNDINSQFKGVRNAHSIMTIRAGSISWTPISAVPKDLEMPGLSRNSTLAICQVFGVDPALMGIEGTADPLSAGSTYSGKEIAHIRNVELPFLRSTILPALNEQWAWTDFGRKDYYTLAVDERAIPALAESQLVKSQTAGQLTNDHLHDYDEAREMVGMERRGGDYLKRKADEPLSVYAGGVSTLNETRRFLGLAPFERDVIVINATPIPVDRFHEVLDANVEQAKNQAAALSPFGDMNAPALPAPDATVEPDEPRAEDDDHSLVLALALENNPELIALQRAVKAYCERQGISVRWHAPDEFHVTLCYAPDVAPEQAARALLAISAIPAPALDLGIGSLRAFESVGEYALHFRVRTNAALIAYQRALYDALTHAGLMLSSYSDPERWTPHVTMGYADSKPEGWTIRKPAHCTPARMVAWHGGEYQEVYEAACTHQSAPETPIEEEAPELALELPLPVRSARADMPVSLDAVFPGHEFIKAARRELSAVLVERGIAAEWVDESAWSIPLAMGYGSASDAASVLRECDYASARKVDCWTSGYAQSNNAIYLALEPSDGLTTMRKSAALDLSLCDGRALDIPGVLLCKLYSDDPIDLSDTPAARFPLVIARVAMFLGSELQAEWELTGESQMQRKTLTNWRHKAKRSADRAAAFNSERWLPPVVDAFIRLSLEDEDIGVDDVFAIADAMLTERAFADTKAAFMNAIRPIFEKVNAGSMSKQAFGGGLRAQLRRFGLMAFRDGMNEVGYDPESFGDTELRAFRDWQARQSAYVTGLSDELFKERGVKGDEPRPLTAGQIEQRVRMWADISLEAAREAGLAVGAPQEKYTWVWDPRAEHCADCLFLNGKTYRMEEWLAADLTPTRGNTECKQGCKCQLKPNPKAKLSPLRLIGLTGSRRSEEDERDTEPDDGGEPYKRHEHGAECGCNAPDVRASGKPYIEQRGDAWYLATSEQSDIAVGTKEDIEALLEMAIAIWNETGELSGTTDIVQQYDLLFRGEEEYDYRSAPDDDTADDDAYDADEQRAVPAKYEHIDFKPSEAMAEEAQRGLDWREEHGRGGTEVGVARARDLKNRKNLSPETARRMKAYFDRHEVDQQGQGWSPGEDGYPSAGRIAWALWGGDPGYSWARQRVESMNAADEKDGE